MRHPLWLHTPVTVLLLQTILCCEYHPDLFKILHATSECITLLIGDESDGCLKSCNTSA